MKIIWSMKQTSDGRVINRQMCLLGCDQYTKYH